MAVGYGYFVIVAKRIAISHRVHPVGKCEKTPQKVCEKCEKIMVSHGG